MTWPAVIAITLVALGISGDPRNVVPPNRAEYFGTTIAAVTDDPDDAAALGVLVVREGGVDPAVEHCRRLGPGGAGAWQLNLEFNEWVIACGHAIPQAYRALDVLYANGWPRRPARAMQSYLGASDARNREVAARLALWERMRKQLRCRCSR